MPLLKKFNQFINENIEDNREADLVNYMFFGNLVQMKRQIEMMLEMDQTRVDAILQDGHNWAVDHLATSKDDIEEVFNFLKGEIDEVDTDQSIKIDEAALFEQLPASFISVFPTPDTLTTKTQAGYSQIGGNDNTNIIYLTRRDDRTGQEIPNSKFSYKVSGSYGLIDFDIILRKVIRSRSTGVLIGEIMPKNSTVSAIIKKLIPANNLTKDGWLPIVVPVDKLNAALLQLHKNKGTSAQIKVEGGIAINLKQIA